MNTREASYGPLCENNDIIHKTGSTYGIATPSEEDRACRPTNSIKALKGITL